MYIATMNDGHLKHWGQGTVLDTGAGENIIYREVSEAAFRAEMEALLGWGGDWRMVVVDGLGVPRSYTVRPLLPEEQAADTDSVEQATVRSEAKTIRASAQATLVDIAAGLAEIDGETVPSTVAQLWQIIQRGLARERAALVRERRYVRVLARLALRAGG